jgi:hypothetical protein
VELDVDPFEERVELGSGIGEEVAERGAVDSVVEFGATDIRLGALRPKYADSVEAVVDDESDASATNPDTDVYGEVSTKDDCDSVNDDKSDADEFEVSAYARDSEGEAEDGDEDAKEEKVAKSHDTDGAKIWTMRDVVNEGVINEDTMNEGWSVEDEDAKDDEGVDGVVLLDHAAEAKSSVRVD